MAQQVMTVLAPTAPVGPFLPSSRTFTLQACGRTAKALHLWPRYLFKVLDNTYSFTVMTKMHGLEEFKLLLNMLPLDAAGVPFQQWLSYYNGGLLVLCAGRFMCLNRALSAAVCSAVREARGTGKDCGSFSKTRCFTPTRVMR